MTVGRVLNTVSGSVVAVTPRVGRGRRGSRTRAAVTSMPARREGDREAASRATAAPIWPKPSRPTRTITGVPAGCTRSTSEAGELRDRHPYPRCRASGRGREQGRPRLGDRDLIDTSKGVTDVVRPSGLSRLFISPGYRAGSSTLARRLVLSLRPGCCGVAGPVPSATLDKCPQRVRTRRMYAEREAHVKMCICGCVDSTSLCYAARTMSSLPASTPAARARRRAGGRARVGDAPDVAPAGQQGQPGRWYKGNTHTHTPKRRRQYAGRRVPLVPRARLSVPRPDRPQLPDLRRGT